VTGGTSVKSPDASRRRLCQEGKSCRRQTERPKVKKPCCSSIQRGEGCFLATDVSEVRSHVQNSSNGRCKSMAGCAFAFNNAGSSTSRLPLLEQDEEPSMGP